jgi:adenine-specific DNA-methyltransferase
MDKLKMHSPDGVNDNVRKIAALFPNCITEDRDETGKLRLSVDSDRLRQELSTVLVEGPAERYTLSWPGKNESILLANAPIAKTLRPCEAESVDFENTRNLYIEGDNLDVLKLLQETYLGGIKMMYIDQPYNTGNDFIYEDDFAEDTESFLKRSLQKDEEGNRMVANPDSNGRFHSDWLSMMYPRLKLARNLLRADGVIFMSVDDNEVHNLRKMCDEIFGEQNFVAQVVWEKMYTTKNDAAKLSQCHEYVLVYLKSIATQSIQLLPRTQEMDARYTNSDNDPRGPWKAIPLYAKGERKNGRYAVVSPVSGKEHWPGPDSHWLYIEEDTKKLIADNRIYFGRDGNAQPNIKRFLTEVQQGTKAKTLWKHSEVGSNDSAKRELREFYPEGKLPFDFPKPTTLLKRMILLSTQENTNDLILDFFSGSATTAHAVIKQNAEDGGNRKFIMVQLPEPCDEKSEAFKAGYKTIAEIGKERIRRAGSKIKAELAEKQAKDNSQPGLFDQKLSPASASSVVKKLDTGFRVFKVDSSNMKDVYYTPDALKQDQLELFKDHIKEDRRPEDLLFQVFLDWGIDLASPIAKETIFGKTVFFVDENVLAACFDKGISEDMVKIIAKRKPIRAVFRDDGFDSDSVKINVEQIFRMLSPDTEVKTL